MPNAKLGMTIQPKKSTPYDKLSDRMQQGAKEELRLTRPGTPYQNKIQSRIPKASPSGRRGSGRV